MEFGIPKKLVNLMKVTLQDSKGKVKIEGQLTEGYGIGKGFETKLCTVYSTVLYCTGESDMYGSDFCDLKTLEICMH